MPQAEQRVYLGMHQETKESVPLLQQRVKPEKVTRIPTPDMAERSAPPLLRIYSR